MRRVPLSFCAGLICCYLVMPAAGDTIIKNNGEKLTGQIVAEADGVVTMQTNVGSIVLRQKIPVSDIKEMQKMAIAENRYCRIPIKGEIGVDVKTEWVAKALEQAAGLNANYIVFEIDSPGGQIGEMATIIEAIKKQNRFHTVALVKRAMSAAAIIALSCDSIAMEPGASIGAAVPWKFGPTGTPEDVEAKFMSAYRALAKAAAETSHHSPLVATGMMDMNQVLSVITKDGVPQVVEGHPANSIPLKKAGEILCLSANDALGCGLAAGSAGDVGAVQNVLKLKDWATVGDSVWAYMDGRPALEKANKTQQRQNQAAANKRQATEKVLADAQARVVALTRMKDEATKTLAALPAQQNAEISKINMDLPLAERENRMAEIRNRYRVMILEAEQTILDTDYELKGIQRALVTAKS